MWHYTILLPSVGYAWLTRCDTILFYSLVLVMPGWPHVTLCYFTASVGLRLCLVDHMWHYAILLPSVGYAWLTTCSTRLTIITVWNSSHNHSFTSHSVKVEPLNICPIVPLNIAKHCYRQLRWWVQHFLHTRYFCTERVSKQWLVVHCIILIMLFIPKLSLHYKTLAQIRQSIYVRAILFSNVGGGGGGLENKL